MPAKTLFTANVHTVGGREGWAKSSDGQLDVRLSVPGSNRPGTNPEQLFAAGWSACFEGALAHAAREQQGFCEGRIQEIEGKLSNAQVIDVTKIANNGRVIFGATVTLLKSETEEEVVYRIVGDDEADIKQNMISVNSPIARALIGKEVDDVAIVKTPGGDVEYEILEVAYL